MLKNIDTSKYQNEVWHKKEFDNYLKKINNYDKNAIQKIKDAINEKLKEGIVTTSWMPGKDWTGTPYEAIYEALDCNHDVAAMCFGIFVTECVIEDEGEWGFDRYDDANGNQIRGMTYFRFNK